MKCIVCVCVCARACVRACCDVMWCDVRWAHDRACPLHKVRTFNMSGPRSHGHGKRVWTMRWIWHASCVILLLLSRVAFTFRDVNLWNIFCIYWSLGSWKGRPKSTAETRVRNKLCGIYIYNIQCMQIIMFLQCVTLFSIPWCTKPFSLRFMHPGHRVHIINFSCPQQAFYA